MNPNSYLLVSDGACSGNPGPGGWGLIIKTPSEQVHELGGHEKATTNNRMELMGFYKGLQEIYRHSKTALNDIDRTTKLIHIISDSKYVLDGSEKFIHGWKKNGWKTATGGEVKNQDIWEKILKGMDILRGLQFQFKYELVKGHSGHEANDRVDVIAVKFSKNTPVDLFRGSRQDYSVNLEGGAPYALTYLSLVEGKLSRHKTWDSCKSATEGKKGSKFKKVKNRLEEQETLKLWGLN